MFSDVVIPEFQRVDSLDPKGSTTSEWIKRERKRQFLVLISYLLDSKF